MKENRWKSVSPGCSVISSKCTLLLSILTGVPVFIRACSMPSAEMEWVSFVAAGSAHLPPGTFVFPTCIKPLRKVPAVMTTDLPRSSAPQSVRMPMTSLFSVRISVASSCQMERFGVFSSLFLHSQMKRARSHCALGLHMAGPLERFSILN